MKELKEIVNLSYIKNTVYDKIIPTIWSIGVLTYSLLLIWGNIKIKKEIKQNIYEDARINKILENCKNSMGITKEIEIILQDFKKTPSIIGLFNPQILITKEFLENNDDTIKYIFMHELSHYKRKDLLLNYILIIVTILHWFNPFVWIFFKKIRQDIEIATDECVINHLQKDEVKSYGLTLINSLQAFQEENNTARILCVTDDSKNMERRIKMLKLSAKFSKNKILISGISLLIITVIVAIFFIDNNTTKAENISNSTYVSELSKCKYKSFVPTLHLIASNGEEYYDFTEDMEWDNSIYHKKINNYEEYLIVKERWHDILDMSESDFENSFMVLTTIENKSMIGLNVDNIETDENNLYISLKLEGEIIEVDEEFDGKMTQHGEDSGISYIIPRSMERDNIVCVRNLRDDEKDFEKNVKIGKFDLNPSEYYFPFQYLTVLYRDTIDKYSSQNSNFTPLQPKWNDFIAENFIITKDMPNINFENWNNLGDDFYSLEVTDYSEYIKLIKNYGVRNFSWKNFENIYVIVIVRANSKNSIGVDNIQIDENGDSYLPVKTTGVLDDNGNSRYQGMVLFVPNYRSLEENHLRIKLEN